MAYLFQQVDCQVENPMDAIGNLDMDYAIVRFSPPPSTLTAYSVSYVYGDCYECPSQTLVQRSAYLSQPYCVQVPVNYETELTFGGPLCSAKISPYTIKPKQFSYHDLTLSTNSVGECQVDFSTVSSEALSAGWVPLICLFMYLFFITSFRWLWIKGQKRDIEELLQSETMDPMLGGSGGVDNISIGSGGAKDELLSPLVTSDFDTSNQYSSLNDMMKSKRDRKKKRIDSLDTFRGLSLTLMIFVNYGGGGYYFFNHSTWNGLTVADLLFPWFVWIMGVTVGVTFKAPEGDTRTSKWLTVLLRCVKLFGLGLLLNSAGGDGDISTLRIPGVLQYFSIAYLYINAIVLFLDSPVGTKSSWTRNAASYTLLGSLSLITYCVLTYASGEFEVDGQTCPGAYLGAGGLYGNEAHPKCTGGYHRYVDVMVLGKSHFYDSPTCENVYDCIAYDPEGIVGSLSASFLAFLGLLTGKIVKYHKKKRSDKRMGMIYCASLGVVLLLLAGMLCDFNQNPTVHYVPVNKNMWSPPFILACGGFANVLFTLLFYFIDYSEDDGEHEGEVMWEGWPLRQVGKNSIVLYMGHELLDGTLPFAVYFTEKSKHLHWGTTLSNAIGVTVWVLIALRMDKKKIYVSV
eukprot:CAMPEP_0182517488 /NCGR_PEP_ID=MMETSP1321-20130603/42345_1 /TAXON_ID=91990 /ORGANISM="Bolidomonas sp., Strain RCC1657" /LENGTH=628 /DNA_ID=CAMNT_0024725237 /DNA_START=76 /DNA_END=1962 /DNA_ORIENTATION=-